MSKYAIARIRRNDFMTVKHKGKLYRSFRSQYLHDTRKEDIEEGYLLRADRSNLNTIINHAQIDLKSDDAVKELWAKAEADYKKHWKQSIQSKPFVTVVLAYSNTINEDIKEYGAEAVHQAELEFLEQEFGKSCIYSATHEDEASRHLHASIINHNFKTHKSFSRNIDTSELQTRFADFMQSKLEWDYVRGKDKKLTKAKHLEIIEAKIKGIDALEEQIDRLEADYLALDDDALDLMDEVAEMYDDVMDIIEDADTKQKWERMLNTFAKYMAQEKETKLEGLLKKMKRNYTALKNKHKPKLGG